MPVTIYPVVDIVFPTDVAFSSGGGYGWETSAIRAGGGNEQRVMHWGQDLGRYDIMHGIHDDTEIAAILEFEAVRRGKGQGFLFKAHENYFAEDQLIGTGNGVLTTFQMVKSYFDPVPIWLPNNPYAAGDKVRPSVYADLIYGAIASGTSGNAEPTWGGTLGTLTTDNTMKWTTLRGPQPYNKTIQKIKLGSLDPLKVGGTPKVEGTDYLINYSTGLVTCTAAPAGSVKVIAPYYEFYLKARFDADIIQDQGEGHNMGVIHSIPIVELR